METSSVVVGLFAALLVTLAILAVCSLPAAYGLLDAAKRRRLGRWADDGSTCGDCGYPLDGLPGDAVCPECGSFTRSRSDSMAWVAPMCVLAGQVPALVSLALVLKPMPEPVAVAWNVLGVVGPAVIAAFAAWLVGRTGLRNLTIGSIAWLGGMPLLVEGAMLLLAWPSAGDGFGRGIPALLNFLVGRVVMAVTLLAFGGGALVAIGTVDSPRRVRS